MTASFPFVPTKGLNIGQSPNPFSSALLAFNRIQDEMAGGDEKAGFSSEEELQAYAKEIRKEMCEKNYASND